MNDGKNAGVVRKDPGFPQTQMCGIEIKLTRRFL